MQRTLITLAIHLLIATASPSRANDLPPNYAPHWLSIDRQFGFARFEGYGGCIIQMDCLVDPSLDFQTLKFRSTTNSIAHTNSTLPEISWLAPSATINAIRNKAIVRRVEGKVEIADKQNPYPIAKVGQTRAQGSILTTAPNSTIDLFLGDNGPILRLTPFTRLDLDYTGLEKIIDTRIHLRRGRLQGNVRKMASASNYLIRTRSNLIRIRGTEFQIDADGTCAIATGAAEVITPTHLITVNSGEIFSPAADNPK